MNHKKEQIKLHNGFLRGKKKKCMHNFLQIAEET